FHLTPIIFLLSTPPSPSLLSTLSLHDALPIYFNPLLALIILLIAIGAFFYFALRILRATKAKIWLAWKKLNGPADRGLPVKLPRSEERRVGKECRCGWSRYE